MYKRFFGLRHSPFSIAPDPRYLFMSERHREALAHLLFGLNGGGGFVLLTGEIGAGKTTVCRLFLEQIPARCNVAYIFNPKQTVIELLQSICDEFGVPPPPRTDAAATVKDFLDPLNTYLLATHAVHQNNVLIIDEAQNLSADVLEQLRLLTNLETSERKLLQIILIGQPELRAMLARPELEQLAQRVIARFHLEALSAEETEQYVAHRLAVAGFKGASPFSRRALKQIHQRTRGVPRRINLLCDRTLLGAYAGGKREVNGAMIRQAAREVFDFDPLASKARMGQWRAGAAGVATTVLILGVVALALDNQTDQGIDKKVTGAHVKPASVAVVSKPLSSTPLPAIAGSSAAPRDVINTAAPIVPGTDSRSLASAYRQLGKLWRLPLVEGDPCAAAQTRNVYCFSSSRGLAEIRQLDRPGILTLQDDDHHSYYALLVGLSAQRAVLQIGDVTETVTLNTLAHRWSGDFATFWRGPEGYRKDIGLGDRGTQVDWLAARLASVDGSPRVAPNSLYDATLLARIREFQLTQGLRPDGRAGPQTCMRLTALTGSDEPHLQTLAVAGNAGAGSATLTRK